MCLSVVTANIQGTGNNVQQSSKSGTDFAESANLTTEISKENSLTKAKRICCSHILKYSYNIE